MNQYRLLGSLDPERDADRLKGLATHEGWPHLKAHVEGMMNDALVAMAQAADGAGDAHGMAVHAGRYRGTEAVMKLLLDIEKSLVTDARRRAATGTH